MSAFQPDQETYLAPRAASQSQATVTEALAQVLANNRENFVLSLPRRKIDQLLVPIQQGILDRDSTFAVKDPETGDSVQINAGEFIDILNRNGIKTNIQSPRTLPKDYRDQPGWQTAQAGPIIPDENFYEEINAQPPARAPASMQHPGVIIDAPITGGGGFKPPEVMLPQAQPQPPRRNTKKYLIIGGITLTVLVLIAVIVGVVVGVTGGKDDGDGSSGVSVSDRILIFGGAIKTIQSYLPQSGNTAVTAILDAKISKEFYRGAVGLLQKTVVLKFSLISVATLNSPPTKTVELFDVSNSGIREATAPNDYIDAAGAIFNGKFYLMGGTKEAADNRTTYYKYCNYLDFDFEWTSCGFRMPDFRQFHTLAAIENDGLYLLGGVDLKDTLVNSVYKWGGGGDWSKIANLPTPAVHMAATTWRGRLVACGGTEVRNQTFDPKLINECHSYNPTSDSWTKMPSMNKGRWIFNLVNFKGTLYALGGSDYNSKLDDSVERYDDLAKKWVIAPNMKQASFGALAVAV